MTQKRILLLSLGRSGSSALRSTVSRHPDLLWHYNITTSTNTQNETEVSLDFLYTTLAAEHADKSHILVELKTIQFSQISWLRKCLFNDDTNELCDNKSIPRKIAECIKNSRLDFVFYLQRYSHLARIMSAVRARKSGVWHATRPVSHSTNSLDKQVSDPSTYQSTLSDLGAVISNAMMFENTLISSLGDTISKTFVYENCIQNDPLVAGSLLLEFLNIRKAGLSQSAYHKTRPFEFLEDEISNYNDVIQWLDD